MTSDQNFFLDKTDYVSCEYFKEATGIVGGTDFLMLKIVSCRHLDYKQDSDLTIYMHKDCYDKLAEIRDAITEALNEAGYKPTNSCNTEEDA